MPPQTMGHPGRTGAAVLAVGAAMLIAAAGVAASETNATSGWSADSEPVVVGRSATSDVSVAAARDGSVVAVAWATLADTAGAVNVVTSVDGGAHFGSQVTLGSGLEDPAAFVLDDGTIVVAALSATDPIAPYWPVLYRSSDGGATFTPSSDLHATFGEQTSRETTPSVALSSDGTRIVVAWHAHSHHDGSHSASPVMATTSRDGGATWAAAAPIAPESCHCCAVSAFVLDDAEGVGFRAQVDVDAATDERDPAFVLTDASGTFGAVQEVHDDHWVMERSGCPASGPRFATDGTAVHAMWWTGAQDMPAWQTSRRGADGRFETPEALMLPDGDLSSLDPQHFSIAVGPGDHTWIMAADFPVGASGYQTRLWQAPAGSALELVPEASHPYVFARAGFDVAAVPGGAVIAFHGEDEILVQRIAG